MTVCDRNLYFSKLQIPTIWPGIFFMKSLRIDQVTLALALLIIKLTWESSDEWYHNLLILSHSRVLGLTRIWVSRFLMIRKQVSDGCLLMLSANWLASFFGQVKVRNIRDVCFPLESKSQKLVSTSFRFYSFVSICEFYRMWTWGKYEITTYQWKRGLAHPLQLPYTVLWRPLIELSTLLRANQMTLSVWASV